MSKLDYFYIHTCALNFLFYLTPGYCPNFRDVKIVKDLLRQVVDVLCLITALFPKLAQIK